MEYYTAVKKERAIAIHNLGGSQGHYSDGKRAISKGHIVYDSIYMASSKWESFRDRK